MGADCSCCGKASNDQCIFHPRGCFEGEAHWVCNCICCPIVCPVQSCWIYCAPCFEIWCNRACACCLAPCYKCCPHCCCYEYTDETFEGDRGLGSTEFGNSANGRVVWERPHHLYKDVPGQQEGGCCGADPEMKLFNVNADKEAMDGPIAARVLVEPGDIKQGALGDCWLLGAMAGFSEVPGGIQNAFVNREKSNRGKYVVNLYSAKDKQWEEIEIDDRIPMYENSLKKGYVPKAAFAQPNGNELWAMLLEKAFAKFCGSYQNLSGGQTVWGLQALTGSEICFRFLWDKKKNHWSRLDIKNIATEAEPRKVEMVYHKDKKGGYETQDSATLFKILRAYNQNKALIAASISGTGSEEKLMGGLIGGHAYTVLRVEFVDPSGGGFLGIGGAEKAEYLKMIQLRNPWGKGEWEGDFSDNSKKWNEFPNVKKALADDANAKSGGDNDGIFWMLWDDFIVHYNNVEVCDRKQSLKDLTLEVHEEDGPCGVCCGCIGGFCTYYCCCVGCHKLYCVRKPSPITIGQDEESGMRESTV